MKEDFLTTAFRRVRDRLRRRGGGDDSDDELQDAFCRLWTRRAEIHDLRHAEGLLTVTTRNIHIDNLRRDAGYGRVPVDEDIGAAVSSESDDGFSEAYGRVDSLVRKHLSDRDREILLRRERDGWEMAELAERFSISEANVRMILSRSRKTIRDLYNGKV